MSTQIKSNSLELMRAKFEAWAVGRVSSMVREGCGYSSDYTHGAWLGWCAALASDQEEIARLRSASKTQGAPNSAPAAGEQQSAKAAAANAADLPADWRADIDNIADELEAEAMNYEGDFADTVKGCAEALHHIADRAAATSAAGQAWVSVDDRLPEDDTEVIVLYWPYDNRENKQVAGHAHFYDGCFFAEDWNPHHPPSHWMPMPAIPTDDRAAAKGTAGQEGAA